MPSVMKQKTSSSSDGNSKCYELGAKFLCSYKDGREYEVKIIGLEQGDNAEPVYKVHYAGWHRRYDESIPHSQALTRFKAIAKENVQKQIHLIPEKVAYQSRKMSTRKKSRGRGSSSGTTSEDVRSTIRPLSRDVSMESDQSEEQSVVPVRSRQFEQTFVSYEVVPVARFRINLTMALQATLYDDSELIIRKMRLTKVPARLSAARIVAMYGEQKKNDISTECALGILDYFNVTLGTQLLYKPERPQYENLIARLDEKERTEMSKYYGFIHLLRLFVRFRSMLAATPQLNERTIKAIMPRIAEFVTWLDENCDQFFDVNLDYETKPQ